MLVKKMLRCGVTHARSLCTYEKNNPLSTTTARWSSSLSLRQQLISQFCEAASKQAASLGGQILLDMGCIWDISGLFRPR